MADNLGQVESMVLSCEDCDLCRTAMNKVFGEGAPDAVVMFVGEAPGQEEDRSGRPFVGRAGELVDAALDKLGIPRPDVFICNILKCRPPGNRRPKKEEITACLRYVEMQIQVIAPKVVVALGATAAKALLETPMSIGKIRGKIMAGPHGTFVVPTWHPSFVLRQSSKSMLKQRATDFLGDIKDAFELADIKTLEL